MTFDVIRLNAQRVSRWSAVALGASIPISTALDNVLIVIALAAWALSGQIRKTLELTLANKVAFFAMALFLMLVMGVAYGEASWAEAISCLKKYADLLYIPVLVMIFRARSTRLHALYALAGSLAGILMMSYVISTGVMPMLPLSYLGTVMSPTVFKLKLTHNLFLAYGAFLFVWLAHMTVNRWGRTLCYGLALLAVVNVLLMVQGATGYLVLGALALLLGWQHVGWRGVVGMLLALTVVLAVSLAVPNPFQERIFKIQRELQDWNPEDSTRTSTGLRLEFYQNSLAIIAQHPLTGVGTGGFPAAYAKQVAGTGKAQTHNPHNEFLHVAVQVGLLGAILLAALFIQQWRLSSTLKSPMERGLAHGLVLTMVIGCLLNSFLLDHAEGLFYAWMSGVLLGGLEYGPPDKLPATA